MLLLFDFRSCSTVCWKTLFTIHDGVRILPKQSVAAPIFDSQCKSYMPNLNLYATTSHSNCTTMFVSLTRIISVDQNMSTLSWHMISLMATLNATLKTIIPIIEHITLLTVMKSACTEREKLPPSPHTTITLKEILLQLLDVKTIDSIF